MPATTQILPGPRPRALVERATDLRWLVRLRWLAIAGQCLTLLLVCLLGQVSFQVGPLLGVELLLIFSNAVLHVLCQRWPRPSVSKVGSILAMDTLLLTVLLALSGGPMNPYTVFYLVHVVMAAVLLDAGWTWGIVALAGGAFASLFWFAPVTAHQMHGSALVVHLYGMLLSFVIAACCAAHFVLHVQRQRRKAEASLSAARHAVARYERFATVTALAAGAAHELATPLGTIAVAARELERTLARHGTNPDGIDDARLIRAEVDRCRLILDALTPMQAEADPPAAIDSTDLLAALRERFDDDLQSRIQLSGPPERATLVIPRHRTLQSLTALVNNALEASRDIVQVQFAIAADALTVQVIDRGCGMDAAAQARVGEPFFTTKPHGRGLGLFLVRQFVEQVGGALQIRSTPGAGTYVTLTLPAAIEEENHHAVGP